MISGSSPDSPRILGQAVRTLKFNALTLTEVRYPGGQKLPWHSHSTYQRLDCAPRPVRRVVP